MAEVEDACALLVMALQDLSDAEAALVERLPQVGGHASDAALVELIADAQKRSAEQRQVLAELTSKLGADATGTRNIWQRAILDDADNDASTIAAGPLLDIALTGALRKGKQSERVSYETAIALAASLEMSDAEASLTAIRDEEAKADAALAEILERLCQSVDA